MNEQNEFMTMAGKDGPDTVEGLSKWASGLLADPKNREAIEKQFRDGKLSVAMFTWLREEADRIEQANKPKSKMQTIVEAATPEELDVLVAVARRARGDAEESKVFLRRVGVRKTFAEIIAVAEEVFRS